MSLTGVCFRLKHTVVFLTPFNLLSERRTGFLHKYIQFAVSKTHWFSSQIYSIWTKKFDPNTVLFRTHFIAILFCNFSKFHSCTSHHNLYSKCNFIIYQQLILPDDWCLKYSSCFVKLLMRYTPNVWDLSSVFWQFKNQKNHFKFIEYIIHGSIIEMIVTMTLLWSEIHETNVMRDQWRSRSGSKCRIRFVNFTLN